MDEKRLTISRPISQQYQSKPRMHNHISLVPSHIIFAFPHPNFPPVRQRQLPLSPKALEHRHNVLRCFIRLVYNNDSTVGNSTEQWRVGVLDDAILECCGEQELIDRRVSVKLDVFARSAQELA